MNKWNNELCVCTLIVNRTEIHEIVFYICHNKTLSNCYDIKKHHKEAHIGHNTKPTITGLNLWLSGINRWNVKLNSFLEEIKVCCSNFLTGQSIPIPNCTGEKWHFSVVSQYGWTALQAVGFDTQCQAVLSSAFLSTACLMNCCLRRINLHSIPNRHMWKKHV